MANERKSLYTYGLKKDKTRVVMKADKGNCFVVMDKTDYDEKMQELLSDQNTYEKVAKPPFKIKRSNVHKLDERTYKK